jgi:hypothetical protein
MTVLWTAMHPSCPDVALSNDDDMDRVAIYLQQSLPWSKSEWWHDDTRSNENWNQPLHVSKNSCLRRMYPSCQSYYGNKTRLSRLSVSRECLTLKIQMVSKSPSFKCDKPWSLIQFTFFHTTYKDSWDNSQKSHYPPPPFCLITFIMFPIKYSVSNSLLEISPSICLVRPCSQLLIL